MVQFFEIGYCRTGTRSLHSAMSHLGYHYWVDGKSEYFTDIRDKAAVGSFDWNVAADGVNDLVGGSAAPFYIPLSIQFPDAKFILTKRRTKRWTRSCRLHYGAPGKRPIPMTDRKAFLRMAMFGCSGFNKYQWPIRYDLHNKNVQEFFAEDRLLVLDVEMDGETKWNLLERFTGRRRPEENMEWPWIRRGNRDQTLTKEALEG